MDTELLRCGIRKAPVSWNSPQVLSVGSDPAPVEGVSVEHKPVREEGTVNYSHAQFTRQLSADEEKRMSDGRARVVVKPKK